MTDDDILRPEKAMLGAALADLHVDEADLVESLDRLRCPDCNHLQDVRVDVYIPTRVYRFDVGVFRGRVVDDGEESITDVDYAQSWMVECKNCYNPFPVARGHSAVERWDHVGEAALAKKIPDALVAAGYAELSVKTEDLLPGDVVHRQTIYYLPSFVFVREVLLDAQLVPHVSGYRVVDGSVEATEWLAEIHGSEDLTVYRPPLPIKDFDQELIELFQEWKSQKSVVRAWAVGHLRSRYPDDAVDSFVTALYERGVPLWHLLRRPPEGARSGLDL